MWKYNCLTELQLKLLELKIIDLQGETDGDMTMYVREATMRLASVGSPDITINITSNGGNVAAGLATYDLLRLYPGKKTGIVTGFAKSMAVLILQACDQRECSRHSDILIHHVSRQYTKLDDLRNKKSFKKILKEMEKRQQRLYSILRDKTGKSLKEIKKVCKKDYNMTSEEALRFGLIDKII